MDYLDPDSIMTFIVTLIHFHVLLGQFMLYMYVKIVVVTHHKAGITKPSNHEMEYRLASHHIILKMYFTNRFACDEIIRPIWRQFSNISLGF